MELNRLSPKPAGMGRLSTPAGLRAVLSCLLAAALLVATIPSVQAAAPAQEGDPLPLLLGELASARLAAGESASFEFEAPDDTVYVITSGDDAEAAKFEIVVADEDGNEVFSGPFATTELELDDGDYVITATALEDAILSLFVTGQIGELDDNSSRPGDMINGGFVTVEGVEETLYGELDIEDTDSWQRVVVYIEGGEDDAYSASVYGEGAYDSISDSSAEAPLEFWTRGGRYTLDVTPVDGSGDLLTVVPLLSGPAPLVEVGVETPATLQAGSTEQAFRFVIEEAGRTVTVSTTSDNEDIDAELVVGTDPTANTWGSYNFGANEQVAFAAPVAGEYIVRVYTNSTYDDPLDFSLLVEVGAEANTLEPNSQVWDSVAPGESDIYVLDVESADEILTIVLVAGGQDLDLAAQQIDEDGVVVTSLYPSSSGGTEVLAQPVGTPGMFEVRVSGTYASEETPYLLDVRLQAPDEVGAQWAVEATASSEFGNPGYSAIQMTGEPTIVEAGDNVAAWASKEPDGTVETVELGYENKVLPTRIRIYESYNPGAVTMVEAYDEENDEWVALWEGEEPSDSDLRVFSPELEQPEFRTNRIRLTVTSDLVPGWNEIDAVQLLGLP